MDELKLQRLKLYVDANQSRLNKKTSSISFQKKLPITVFGCNGVFMKKKNRLDGPLNALQ